jgi:hypothetical protein
MDKDGIVALSSIGNVANRARVSLEEAQAAIDCLESPDAHNPDQAEQGRRIQRIPEVGWFIFNAEKYNHIAKAEDIRASTRERTRRWREKLKEDIGDAPVTECDESVTPSVSVSVSVSEEKEYVANATASVGKKKSKPKVSTDHQRLMDFHAQQIGTILDGGVQGQKVKLLLKHYSPEDCIACYEYQLTEPWRHSVSWATVASGSGIANWVKANKPSANGHVPLTTEPNILSPDYKNAARMDWRDTVHYQLFFNDANRGDLWHYNTLKTWYLEKYPDTVNEIKEYEQSQQFREITERTVTDGDGKPVDPNRGKG